MTLIEIAFALALVVTAVVAMLLVFPSGIRAQTFTRYKLIAATKAIEMMEWYRDGSIGGTINDGNDLDKEGVMPWDGIATYRSFAPDLECAITNMRGGFKPLPNEIARRLDSDNDEIARVLDDGGYVFYCSQPYLNGFLDGPLAASDQNWMAETSQLLIAIVGYPQQNSILYHPSVKVGPYQDFYPSPPTYVDEVLFGQPNQPLWSAQGVRFIDLDALCRDPDIAEIMASKNTYSTTVKDPADATKTVAGTFRFGYRNYLRAVNVDTDPTVAPYDPNDARESARAYVLPALWYARHVGLVSGGDDPYGIASKTALESFVDAHATNWKQVLAMRYLAHAAACLTRQYSIAELTSGVDLSAPAYVGPDGAGATPANVTLDLVKAWHETSLRLAVKFADKAGPYDWGAPRPLNRQTMMDHPLCQLDLWSLPIEAPIPSVGASPQTWRQWRACYPQRIKNPGAAFSYPGRNKDSNGDGTIDARDSDSGTPYAYPQRKMDVGAGGVTTGPGAAEPGSDGYLDEDDRPVPAPGGWQAAVGPRDHFNLTLPFDPADRCRQIVVWAVDWQSYEDFETAPSAPIDASRYPIVAPYPTRNDSSQTAWNSDWVQRDPLARQNDAWYRSGVLFSECIRNPEHIFLFRQPSLPHVGTNDEVMCMSDINNFGGGVDYGNLGSPVNESNPLPGESPDMSTPQNSITSPYFPSPDDANLSWNRKIFMGRFGANRNGVTVGSRSGIGATLNDAPPDSSRYYATGHVDKGPVPKHIRLRATTVCRFNFYDSRVSGCLRN